VLRRRLMGLTPMMAIFFNGAGIVVKGVEVGFNA
jgi:hypothetical protein